MRTKTLGLEALLLALVAAASPAHADESPAAILDRTRAVYEGLSSYADTGTVVHEYGKAERDEHRFNTTFNRSPRRLVLDFRNGNGDRLVIWADPDAFHTWWKATGQTFDHPNPNNTNAIVSSDYPTKAVSTKVLTLLYGKANLPGAFQRFVPEREAGLEPCGEKRCHRLEGSTSDMYGASGKVVNHRKMAVWIEVDTYLVRKVVEDGEALPGERSRTTTSFVPQANPKLADDALRFSPPK